MVRKKKINSIKVILLFHNKTGQSTGQLPTSFVKKTGDYSNTKSNYVALCRQRKAGCFDAEGCIELYKNSTIAVDADVGVEEKLSSCFPKS